MKWDSQMLIKPNIAKKLRGFNQQIDLKISKKGGFDNLL